MKSEAARREDRRKLDQAYDELESQAPDRMARAIRWLRDPKGRWVRIPLGLLIVVVSLVGPVVPVVGIEFLPIGLLLIAQDFPPLQRPVADMTLWLERKWLAFRKRRQERSRPH